jgi:hypothetical protein
MVAKYDTFYNRHSLMLVLDREYDPNFIQNQKPEEKSNYIYMFIGLD